MINLLTSERKKFLKKLYQELADLNEHKPTVQEYIDCIRKNNIEQLTWFSSMGSDIRKQIMNIHAYRKGLRFGYTTPVFNEYGWLRSNDRWKETEQIEVRTKKDQNYCNTIYLACGENGLWTYGLTFSYGGAGGGGWRPCFFDTPYPSRHSSLKAALDDLEERMTKQIAHAIKYPDTTNYKIDYMNEVIVKSREIEITQINEIQLTLF